MRQNEVLAHPFFNLHVPVQRGFLDGRVDIEQAAIIANNCGCQEHWNRPETLLMEDRSDC